MNLRTGAARRETIPSVERNNSTFSWCPRWSCCATGTFVLTVLSKIALEVRAEVEGTLK